MLRITTDNGTLVVSPETKIALTITNPMLNDRGSGSLPFTVPDCEHNQRVLGYPTKLTRSNSNAQTINCEIENDLGIFKGTLSYTSSSDGNLEMAFFTNEGGFWNWAKAKKLREINTRENRVMDFTEDREFYFDNIWPTVEMAFFPVAINLLGLDNYAQTENFSAWAYRKLAISDYTILNNPSDLFRQDYDSDRSGNISGFLYLNEIIHWIAETFGVRINSNYLASTNELKSSVVLNNFGFNSIMNGLGYIDYSQLLPNTTVMEFITAIEVKFGCIFNVDLVKREMNIRSVKDVFYDAPKKIKSNLQINGVFNKLGLTLRAGRSNSPYILVNERAIDNYMFTYDTQAAPLVNDFKMITAANPDYVTFPDKFVFCTSTQNFFRLKWIQDGDEWNYIANCMHSNYYDVNKNPDYDRKTIESKSEFVPMIPVNIFQFYEQPSGGTHTHETISIPLIVPHFEYYWTGYFDFSDDIISLNVNDTPIVFAFYRGRIETIEDIPSSIFGISNFNIPMGSVDIYKRDGSQIPNATLAMRFDKDGGIYEAFYKEIEQLFLKSAQQVNVSNFDVKEIFKNPITSIFQNDSFVNFFFKEVKLTLSMDGYSFDSASGITVKPYL